MSKKVILSKFSLVYVLFFLKKKTTDTLIIIFYSFDDDKIKITSGLISISFYICNIDTKGNMCICFTILHASILYQI